MSRILIREQRTFRWDFPVYAQRIILDGYTAICFRRIKIIALILKDGCFAQHCKTVSEATRDKELTVVVLRQLYGDMTAISRGTLADIHSHVKHGTTDTTHKFALRKRRALEMKTAHHAIA